MSIITYAGENNLAKIIEGYTALIMASFSGHFDTVKYLVEHNSEINEKDNDGFTALIWASRCGHFKIVKYLVQHNCLINEKTNYGNTALILASYYSHFKIVKYLVQNNAKIYKRLNMEMQQCIFVLDLFGYLNFLKVLY